MAVTHKTVSLVLKAVALGMAVVSIVLGLLPEATYVSIQVTLLSIGLFALALAALQKEEKPGENTLWKTQ